MVKQPRTIVRVHREFLRMAGKITVKKAAAEDAVLKIDQSRPSLGRFRLQVDRQTKSAFESLDEAEKAGKAIKTAHPLVQVSVYDAQESVQKILD
jgi:hypothetical protein